MRIFLSVLLTFATGASAYEYFQRIASFPICQQIDDACNTDITTNAEIVVASTDGNTLIYTDFETRTLGFVDISDPSSPVASGTIDVDGEPTSVAVCGDNAIVVVNTSDDYINTSGIYHVIDIPSKNVLRTDNLSGQPDSIAVSPDCTVAVVAIENERDEELDDGRPPQLPAGTVDILDISSSTPGDWTLSSVDITGLDGVLYPEDPEPEFVSINSNNVAVVTLQENNAIVLIDLETSAVITSFTAGTVNLSQVDTIEEERLYINQTGTLSNIPREPDGVVWIDDELFATADEGDMDGGSRGFTIFNSTSGDVVYTSGSDLEDYVTRYGHYPDCRSENKGNEPENVAFGIFGGQPFLFVVSERSSLVFVYKVDDPTSPVFVQVLPAGAEPEGAYAIPSRDLLVVASEVDNRQANIRSSISIYQYGYDTPSYPTLISGNRDDDTRTPIPFSALSGLTACLYDCGEFPSMYAVEDQFFLVKRILEIRDGVIVSETFVLDTYDIFKTYLEGAGLEVSDFVNDDKTINSRLEGLSVSKGGGFWAVQEGRVEPDIPNLLFKINSDAVMEQVIELPEEIQALKIKHGFEGVAEYENTVAVAFQHDWTNLWNPVIGFYDVVDDDWSFLYYRPDEVESQRGGWVGLSDIASVGDGSFLVLECDNRAGPDAAVKRIYMIHPDVTSTMDMEMDMETYPILEKILVRDIMQDLQDATNGLVVEKVKGLTLDTNGDMWIVNDNDGLIDGKGETLSGETLLLNLGPLNVTMQPPSPAPSSSPVSSPTSSPVTPPLSSPTSSPSSSSYVSLSASSFVAILGIAMMMA